MSALISMLLPSYSSGTSDVPLLGDTIGGNFDRTVAAHPDREALVEAATGRRWTYRELAEEVDAFACGLLDAGRGKGDRVGIWAPNCAEWMFVQYATAKIGAILVNINPAYRAHELEYVLKQAGIRCWCRRAASRPPTTPAMIDEVRARVAPTRRGGAARTPTSGTHCSTDTADRAGRDRDRVAQRQAELSADDPINIQYTSGTTGFPKGATLTHHNILNNGFFVGEVCGYTEIDRVCIPVPFYHCFGMVMGNLACTVTARRWSFRRRASTRRRRWRRSQNERCTSLYGVPTMFIAELAEPDFAAYDLSTLRTGIMAGSPCPVEVMKQVIDEMGMTEVTDLLRHDRDLAGVHPDPRATTRIDVARATVGRVQPARRGQDRRPGDRADGAARRAGRTLHPRLLGDARLLEAAGEDRRGRSTPRAGCTPATSR